jgi:PAS domain S-box-containing protein
MLLPDNKDRFDRQIEETYLKLDMLRKRVSGTSEEASVATEALEELSTTLEQLHAASDELSSQNNALAAAQVELEAERQHYRDLFEFAPDGYIVTSEDGIIQKANQAASDLLHVPSGKLAGKPLAIFIAEADRKEFRNGVNNLQAQPDRRNQEWEMQVQPRHGQQFPVSITVSPIYPAANATGQLLWLLRDISVRKKVQSELDQYRMHLGDLVQQRTSELTIANARFQAEIDAHKRADAQIENLAKFPSENPNPVLRVNNADILLFANQASQPLLEESHAVVGERLPAAWQAFIKDARQKNTTAEVLFGDRIFSFDIYPIQGMDYINLYGREISDRKKMAKELERQNHKIAEILNSIQDDFYVLDRDWNFVYTSRQFTSRIGKEPEDFIGKNIWEMFPKHLGTELERNFRASMDRREVRTFELGGQYTDAWYRMTSFPSAEGITVLGTDISERKRAELALQESEEHFRVLVENSPDLIMRFDRNLRVVYANPATLQRLQVSQESLVGRTALEYGESSESALAWEQAARRALETGEPMRVDLASVWSWGTRIFDAVVVPERYANGLVGSVMLIARDITEKKQVEQELSRNESDLRGILDVTRESIWMFDLQGNILMANQTALARLGKPAEEVYGKPFNLLIPQELVQSRLACLQEVVETGRPVELEDQRGDIVFEHIFYPVKDSTGQVVRVVSYSRDITGKKQAEEIAHKLLMAVQAEKDRVTTLVNSISDEVWFADANKKFTLANPAAMKEFGIDPSNLSDVEEFAAGLEVFRPDGSPRPIDEAPPLRALMGELVRNQEEIVRIPTTGEFRHREVTASTVKDASGAIIGAVSVVRDITERKQVEEALRQSEELLNVIVTNSPDHMLVQDRDLRYTFVVNPQLGLSEQDMLGKTDFDFLEKGDAGNLTRIKQRVLEDGTSVHVEFPLLSKSGEAQYFNGTYVPKFDAHGQIDGLIGYFKNVTELKRFEEQQLLLNRTLRALSSTNQAMIHSITEQEFLDAVCRTVVEDCGHAMVWVGFKEQDEAKSVRPVASFGFEEGYLETLKISWADNERGRGPTGMAIRTGQTARCLNMLADPKFAPWRDQALKRGYASSIVLPLKSGNQAFGAITIYSRQPEAFSYEEEELLTELAGDLAFGLQAIRTRIANDQAEAALQASENRYRSLFNGMTEGFALHEIICNDTGDPCDYRFLDINPAFEQLTGLKRADVVGRTHNEVLPDDSADWVAAYGKVALTGEPVTFDNYSPSLKRHYDVFAYQPMQGQFAVIFMDVTERKRIEQSLRESDLRFRLALKHAPVTIAIQDRDLHFQWAYNQRTVDPNSVIGKTDADLFAPEDAARLVALKRKVMKTEKSVSSQLWLTSGGKRLFLDLFIEPLRDPNGAVTGIGIATVDLTPMKIAEQAITQARDELELRVHERTSELVNANEKLQSEIVERTRAVTALRDSEEHYRTLFETSPDAVMLANMDHKIVFANQQAAALHGYDKPDELVGRKIDDLIAPDDRMAIRQSVQKALEVGSLREIEYQFLKKDGTCFPGELNLSVVHDEHGNPTGFLKDIRDVTDRKQFEAQLVQAEKHAVIGRMVGSITHEINNPLQTIKNCLYLIQQDVTPESPIQEPLEMATSETLRITTLVGQLRELYRPKSAMNKEPHEVLDILEETHSLLIPHLNNASVEWLPQKGLQRCYINCVRDQILEVFLNICINAIEAMLSHGGKLYVNMHESESRVAVIFKDTGPGIPNEILLHLFEPFMTTKTSGLGLGLSITYGIVQRHGGQIQVENQPGQGATFTVLLPLNAQGRIEEETQHDT